MFSRLPVNQMTVDFDRLSLILEKKADIDPWRKELQDLAKAAGLSTESQDKAREEPRTRTSQYSAATGRLIPPPTKGLSRASSRAKTAQFINNVNTPGDILGQPNMEDEVGQNLDQHFSVSTLVPLYRIIHKPGM